MASVKVQELTLTVTAGGKTHTINSPAAEGVYERLKKVVVGQEVITYFDKGTKKFRSFTFCCGDMFEPAYTEKEVEVRESEFDCCGFPVTYKGA